MMLVCYHPEQNAPLRIYDCDLKRWWDMRHIDGYTSLAWLIDVGWEVVGEL